MVIVLLVKFYYCGVQITMELVLTIMPIFVSFFAFVFVFVFSGLCLCFLHNRPQFSTGSSQMAEKGKKNILLDHKNYTKDDIYALLVLSNYGQESDGVGRAESHKPRQRVSNADRKVFANPESFLRQVHYWLKNFWILCNTKYPDNMQSVRMNWNVSGQSKECPDNLENVCG